MSSQPSCVNCGLYVVHGDCLCDDCRPKVKDPKRRIAELEEEVECLSGSALYKELVAYKALQEARIAELEADVKREHDCVEHWSLRAEQAEAELAALKAEVERLKCCGNCNKLMQHMRLCKLEPEDADGTVSDRDCYAVCQFFPSRWEARP